MGGSPLSLSAFPRAACAVGLTATVGVPPAGDEMGVGEGFTVGVRVGEGFAVGETVGVAGVGESTGVFVGVTVTGGRLTGEPCGPVGVAVPWLMVPGVAPGVDDELAIEPVLLELEANRMLIAVRGAPEASRTAIICSPSGHVGRVPSHRVVRNVPRASVRTQAG